MQLGLSETTWEDAKIKYLKLAAGGYKANSYYESRHFKEINKIIIK
jgi:hypothetical protein